MTNEYDGKVFTKSRTRDGTAAKKGKLAIAPKVAFARLSVIGAGMRSQTRTKQKRRRESEREIVPSFPPVSCSICAFHECSQTKKELGPYHGSEKRGKIRTLLRTRGTLATRFNLRIVFVYCLFIAISPRMVNASSIDSQRLRPFLIVNFCMKSINSPRTLSESKASSFWMSSIRSSLVAAAGDLRSGDSFFV